MFDGFKMLGGMDTTGTIVIVVIVLVVGLIFFIKKGYARAEKQEALRILELTHKYEQEKIETKKESKTDEGPKEPSSILGKGDIPCMAFKLGNIVDWTTIPAPIGEAYLADTSCPISGTVFIVKQLENGDIVDYDPREVPVVIKQTPEWAYSATHCKEIVKRFWYVPYSVWKSPSLWFAAGMLVIMFIFGMGVIGS